MLCTGTRHRWNQTPVDSSKFFRVSAASYEFPTDRNAKPRHMTSSYHGYSYTTTRGTSLNY